jgi:hypothetical protein
MSLWIQTVSLCVVSVWFGMAVGAHLWRKPPRSNVYTFSTGQQVAASYLFEWLSVTELERWPPMSEVLEAARLVGSGFSAVEVDRIVTAVRPMAQRAAQRGLQAMS